MKSTTFLNIALLSLLFNIAAVAQEENISNKKFFVGVHATPTYTNRIWGMPSEFKPAVGFVSGVSWQCNFSTHWALHVELDYERSGFTVIDRNIYFDSSSPFYVPLGNRLTQTIYGVNNIQLPISMKYIFISKEKISAFVNAGTISNYIFSFDGESTYADGSTFRFHEKCSFTNPRNNNLGFLVGLGTDITLCKHMHLTLEARATNSKNTSYGLFTGLTYQLLK